MKIIYFLLGTILAWLATFSSTQQIYITDTNLDDGRSSAYELEQDPGLVIHGRVWQSTTGGEGLSNVKIYLSFVTPYFGNVVAITDSNGFYKSDFIYMPGEEYVRVWAELEGYNFEPEYYSWRHYYGYSERSLYFWAIGTTPSGRYYYMPLLFHANSSTQQ